jgi:hypothetical protein
MALEFTASPLADALAVFRQYKALGDKAIAQVADPDLVRSLDPEMNSIAAIVKHLAGNMRSRWTDFLTTDGEKPDRDRDSEFVNPAASRQELLAQWEQGWQHVFAALEPLTDDDLGRTVTIRGERHTVLMAINRQIAHYACHIGQIILLAKHFRSSEWESLSIPRNRSAEFNARVASGEASQR